MTAAPQEPWDAGAHDAAIRRLAWVMTMTIRIETATAPEAVRTALRELAAGGGDAAGPASARRGTIMRLGGGRERRPWRRRG